ncbi:MAG: hypothetical protein Q9187_006506 [Circinaria calcarea]
MKTSSRQYELIVEDFPKELSAPQLLNEWNLKDADTWGPVKRDTQIETLLHFLHPSLIRLGIGGVSRLVLLKPVAIVTRPGRKENSTLQTKRGEVSRDSAVRPKRGELSDYLDHLTPLSIQRHMSPERNLADNTSLFNGSSSSSDDEWHGPASLQHDTADKDMLNDHGIPTTHPSGFTNRKKQSKRREKRREEESYEPRVSTKIEVERNAGSYPPISYARLEEERRSSTSLTFPARAATPHLDERRQTTLPPVRGSSIDVGGSSSFFRNFNLSQSLRLKNPSINGPPRNYDQHGRNH